MVSLQSNQKAAHTETLRKHTRGLPSAARLTDNSTAFPFAASRLRVSPAACKSPECPWYPCSRIRRQHTRRSRLRKHHRTVLRSVHHPVTFPATRNRTLLVPDLAGQLRKKTTVSWYRTACPRTGAYRVLHAAQWSLAGSAGHPSVARGTNRAIIPLRHRPRIAVATESSRFHPRLGTAGATLRAQRPLPARYPRGRPLQTGQWRTIPGADMCSCHFKYTLKSATPLVCTAPVAPAKLFI